MSRYAYACLSRVLVSAGSGVAALVISRYSSLSHPPGPTPSNSFFCQLWRFSVVVM
jgi:hypothetical protein